MPRDRTEYNADQTRAGIIVNGSPARGFRYDFEVSFGSALVDAVTESDAVDVDGDGELDEVSTYSRASSGINVHRAAVDWDPTEHFGVSVGQMRIPLSVENQITNTKLLFPNRAAANEVFLQGSDFGALARLAVRDSKMRVSAGVFNGTDPTTAAEAEARGPLYSFRADIDPMGPMENGGRDTRGGAVRFGFGAGLVYYPSTTFDAAGFAGTKMRRSPRRTFGSSGGQQLLLPRRVDATSADRQFVLEAGDCQWCLRSSLLLFSAQRGRGALPYWTSWMEYRRQEL